MNKRDKIKIAWINLVYSTTFQSLDEVTPYFLDMANLHSEKAYIEAIVVNGTRKKWECATIQRMCGINRGRIKLIRDRLLTRDFAGGNV